MRRQSCALDPTVVAGVVTDQQDAIVSGAQVRRSILLHSTRVDEGSSREDAVVLPGVQIGCDVRLRRAIVDKRCVLPAGLRIGFDEARDRERFNVTERGVVLVTPEMLAKL